MSEELAIGPTSVSPGGISGLGYINGAPVSGSITSAFGPRPPIWTAVGWTSGFHSGIDIWDGDIAGKPVIAGCDQLVVSSGPAMNGYGNAVFTRAASGHQLLYAHLRDGSIPAVGSFLTRGTVVGNVGNTGASTADHLHFGLMMAGLPDVRDVNTWVPNNLWLDPTPFLVENVAQPVVSPPIAGGLPAPGSWAMVVTTRTTSPEEIRLYLESDPRAQERSLWMLVGGTWLAYIFGAPAAVNAAFPATLPANTAVLVMA